MNYEKPFSEFEIKNTSIKFEGDESAVKAGCVGSIDEAMNSKTITKKCEGVVAKTIVRGDGTGEIKISLHMRYDLYLKTYGMVSDGLIDGVYGYGKNSRHNPFCLTAEAYDEDGNGKLKAYPNCMVTSGIARKIENGAEEVAEIELTASVMPDENGFGMYEAIITDSLDSSVISSWLTNFTPDLVKATSA